MISTYSLTFHRTFSLSRTSISKVLSLAKNKPGFKTSELQLYTDLGTIYQEAMPRYASRAGLLEEKKNVLTPFGKTVAEHDPSLEKLDTQWLLHYHLAAPHGVTAFWHFLVRKRFLSGNIFTASDLVDDLKHFLLEHTGKTPAQDSIRSTAAIFSGTYLKSDGLGRLELLEQMQERTYRVGYPNPPSAQVIGYALTDYWKAHYDGRLTINLDDLTHGDFAAIFLLGEESLTQILLQLKQEGMLDLYRISHPYQVVLLQPEPELALQRLYAR
ncbi:MAG: DUF4007 family protein [Anaerolineae bacterium]|nr:DUF4007 family protein [Anaerolineae bacterium]